MHQADERAAVITPDDRAFFEQMGGRIRALRKARELTQVELAEKLGVSQQQIVAFEKGTRRVPVSALPTLADALGASVEELIGAQAKPSKRGPTPKLAQQLEQLSKLPRSQQRFVSQMLDTVLQQASR